VLNSRRFQMVRECIDVISYAEIDDYSNCPSIQVRTAMSDNAPHCVGAGGDCPVCPGFANLNLNVESA